MTLAVRDPQTVRESIRRRPASLPVDIYSTEAELVVTATVPGVQPDSIEITVEDEVLTIKGETPALDESARYLYAERYHGPFIRSLKLNIPVKQDQIEATFENGILTVVVPKAEEIRPRMIKVQSK